MNATDHAWAAGIIDADGHITIARKASGYYSLTVVVAQAGDTTPPVIARLHEMYGGNLWHSRKVLPRRPIWHWQVTSAQAGAVLEQIAPYLVGKAEQGRIALEYRALVGVPGARISPAARAAMADCFARMRATTNYTRRQ